MSGNYDDLQEVAAIGRRDHDPRRERRDGPGGRDRSAGADCSPRIGAAEVKDPTLLERLCEAGVGASCLALANIVAREAPDDPKKREGLLDRACYAEQPSAAACEAAGDLRASSSSSNAAYVYYLACEQKAVSACSKAAAAYEKLALWGQARTSLTDGCDQGDVSSCLTLGRWLDQGYHVERDQSRSAVLRARACDLGAKYACGSLN